MLLFICLLYMNLHKLTEDVCKIAEKAAIYLREQRRDFDPNKIVEKNSHDYVSYVDQETEQLLIKELSSLLPGSGFVTEEGIGKYTNEEYCWVIDPLDGTTNFIHNIAPYCVSIALRKNNDIIIGVIYEVCADECFYAYKGGGAFLNGVGINVSDTNTIDACVLGLGLPYNAEIYKPVINHVILSLYGKASSMRINGSAAMSMCYVACGRYDSWFEAYIKCWDYSAGTLIVKEAGGKISNFYGEALTWGEHHIIASNNYLHTYCTELLLPFKNKMDN